MVASSPAAVWRERRVVHDIGKERVVHQLPAALATRSKFDQVCLSGLVHIYKDQHSGQLLARMRPTG